MFPNLLHLLVLLLLGCAYAMRQQSLAVKGRLRCGTKPAVGVKVKLMDKDTTMDPDDVIDQGVSDADGRFQLQGDESEFSDIDPQLKIYHRCKKGVNLCKREWVLEIPQDYITPGKTPNRVFDVGTLNLEVELDDESRDCIH